MSLDVVQSNSQRRTLIGGLLGLGLLLIGLFSLWYLAPQIKQFLGLTEQSADDYVSAVPVVVDFDAPALQLTDLLGNPVSLQALKGQVVLVNNWATWCPPCKAEMPTLQAYYEAHQQQGFVIVAIEAGQPVSEVAAFSADYGLTFPVWPDPKQQAMRAFREQYLPASYVLNADGQVVLYWSGPISRAMLDKHVTPLLKE